VRLYRLLLRAFPSAFRDRFGEDMTELFADRRRDARRRGAAAVAGSPGSAFGLILAFVASGLRTTLFYEFRPGRRRGLGGAAGGGGRGGFRSRASRLARRSSRVAAIGMSAIERPTAHHEGHQDHEGHKDSL
jgi:hypothetical protein